MRAHALHDMTKAHARHVKIRERAQHAMMRGHTWHAKMRECAQHGMTRAHAWHAKMRAHTWYAKTRASAVHGMHPGIDEAMCMALYLENLCTTLNDKYACARMGTIMSVLSVIPSDGE
jgi:hypothetical protein